MGLIRGTLRALTAFDWISPVINTIDDASHGFGGRAIFVKEEQLEVAENAISHLDFWSAERYGPFDSEASLTLSDKDYRRAILAITRAGIKITR